VLEPMGRGVLDARFHGHDRRVAQGPSRHLKRPSHATDSPDRRLDRAIRPPPPHRRQEARAEKQKFVRQFKADTACPIPLQDFTSVLQKYARIPLPRRGMWTADRHRTGGGDAMDALAARTFQFVRTNGAEADLASRR
jgi:hypothetical protein